MEKNLLWIKKAFNRTIEFKDSNDTTVGNIKFRLFEHVVISELYDKKISFDIHGFFKKEVNILDENQNQLGKIHFGLRSNKAEIELNNGEKYIWKRADFFLTKWELIHDLPLTDNDPIVIDYDRTRNFLGQEGKITLYDTQENQELLTLIGFFVGFYFLRRRRRAAVVAAS